MKTIIIMRHGKAADGMGYSDDFERPLEQRGKMEVHEAAIQLKEKGFIPDIIIASPACRTAVTARISADVFGIPTEAILYQSNLYMSSLGKYFSAINLSEKKCILIVGHNPYVGELSMLFSNYKIHSFPTSAAAVFQFDKTPINESSKAEMVYINTRK